MQGRTDTDILVIGAGPTGLLLSNLLGSMGVMTTLVERNETTVQEPRAVSIDDESMRALQAAGLHNEVSKITAKGYGSIYKGPDGRAFAEVKPVAKEFGFDKRNAFEQPTFEGVLRQGLQRHKTVTALFGSEVTSIRQTDELVEVDITSSGQTRTLSSAYVVACDGGRSPTRKRLGIKMEGATFEEPWLIVDLQKTNNPGFHTEVFCDPARSAISLPGPGGIRRYEFKLNPGETAEDAEKESFARNLMARVGPDADAPIRRCQVYTFHARTAERWREDRIFLAGDAAHLTPPFAGQGMNSGLRDAHNLAWKLDEALKMADPTHILDSYQTERKPHAQAMIDLALKMGRVMIPSSPTTGMLTRTGFRILSLYPPARDYVAHMKYKPRPRFAAGMLEADGQSGTATTIGKMIPQPLVVTHDRREMLLDDVLPDAPVALCFDEHPERAIPSELRTQLNDAGILVVGLTPEWMNPAQAEFPIVRDRSNGFGARPFADYLGHVLLLRRDRYVFAACTTKNAIDLCTLAAEIHNPTLSTTWAKAPRLSA
ncbi:MAG: bifunctional 3-(3-hydroxy-phenyl)propionate/3-hydroxycinnamic acid hydroxylase [Pseudomonadota bacterium]